MGGYRLNSIAILIIIGGLGGVLGGLGNESIEIGQIDFGADEVVDFC